MKVQIQVFRNSAVSVQRIGRPYLAGKDMGPEIIDNSYLVLPPVDVNDGIDICVVAWILWPDEERSSCPNLEKVVRGPIFTLLSFVSCRTSNTRDIV